MKKFKYSDILYTGQDTILQKEVYSVAKKVFTIDEIKRIIAPIARRYKVDRIYLFGSYARGEANESSDIDLCIDAIAIRGLFAIGALYADLQEAFGKDVDLITVRSLKYNTDTNFIDNVAREQVLIYEAA